MIARLGVGLVSLVVVLAAALARRPAADPALASAKAVPPPTAVARSVPPSPPAPAVSVAPHLPPPVVAAEELRTQASSDPDAARRASALAALARRSEPGLRDFLAARSRADADPQVRQAANDLLTRLQSGSPVSHHRAKW